MGSDCVRNWSDSLTTLVFNRAPTGDALGGEGGEVGSRHVPFAVVMLNFVTIIIHGVGVFKSVANSNVQLLCWADRSSSTSNAVQWKLTKNCMQSCNHTQPKRTPALKSVSGAHLSISTSPTYDVFYNGINNATLEFQPQLTVATLYDSPIGHLLRRS